MIRGYYIKRVVWALAAAGIAIVIICNSVYIENLETRKRAVLYSDLNPRELVNLFWKNELENLMKKAPDLRLFDSLLRHDPEYLCKQYGHTIGLAAKYSMPVRGSVTVRSTGSDKICIGYTGSAEYNILLGNIYTNTARDATGHFRVDDFENTMDFNSVSAEMNRYIKENVIAGIGQNIQERDRIRFCGAVEIDPMQKKDIVNIIPFNVIKTANEE